MMHADFQYRDKIAIAVIGQETEMGRQLKHELAAHPWFVLASGDEPIVLTIDLIGHSEASPRISEGAVPVVIPELYSQQRSGIPSVVGLPAGPSAALALALEPLQKAFGLKAVRTVVMSGPGCGPNNAAPNSLLGARVEREVKDVLHFSDTTIFSVDAMNLSLSQQTVQCVSVTLEKNADCDALKKAWAESSYGIVSLGLPSAGEKVVQVWDTPQGPPVSFGQFPSLGVQISRVQNCPIFGYKFVVTSNARRAGALLLAELFVKMGKVFW